MYDSATELKFRPRMKKVYGKEENCFYQPNIAKDNLFSIELHVIPEVYKLFENNFYDFRLSKFVKRSCTYYLVYFVKYNIPFSHQGTKTSSILGKEKSKPTS